MAKTIFTKEQDEILKLLYPILSADVANMLPFTKNTFLREPMDWGCECVKKRKVRKQLYMLGILWADGHIDKKLFRITLSIVEMVSNCSKSRYLSIKNLT